jgi:hypothetical protein
MDTDYRKIGHELRPPLGQFYNSPALSVELGCIKTVFMTTQTDPVSEKLHKETKTMSKITAQLTVTHHYH